MMQRLVQLRQPIRLYLEDAMTEEERKLYDLTEAQWSIAKNILSLLEAVDEVTTTLSGETYSTLSWCLPLLFGLREAAKPDKNDNAILSGIKRKFTDQFNSRFQLNALEIDSPVVLSAALDPRFRKLSFLSEPEQAELQEVLVQKANAVKSKTNDSSDSSGTTISDGNKTSEPPVKRRMSVLDRLLGDEEKEEEDLCVLEEVKLYLQECPIKRREDPLCW